LVSKDDLEAVYETNLFKIRTKNDKLFGYLTEVNGQIYEAYEIQFHTPGEHKVDGLQIDMEIQVIHRSINQNKRN